MMNNSSNSNQLNEEEFSVIEKSLGAYLTGLEPTAFHVKEVGDWCKKVSEVRHKVLDLLIRHHRGM
jgi:hypothetical protein